MEQVCSQKYVWSAAVLCTIQTTQVDYDRFDFCPLGQNS